MHDHVIYSDGIHLISTRGVAHLHQYCASIGIHPGWFHRSSRFPHYDVPFQERDSFFEDHPEVQRVSSKEIVRLLKQAGLVDKA
jgi:hypothetical protein